MLDSQTIANLLEATARATYEDKGPRAVHRGQWAVMRFLAEADFADRTVGGVADALGVTHAPASRAIGALVRKSYVAVSNGVDDRRVRQIELTHTGRALLTGDPIGRLKAAIESLEAAEAKQFGQVLATLNEKLS